MLSSAHKKFPFLVWWQDISQWRDREHAAFSKPSQSDVWDPFLSPYCYCFPNTPKWRSSASQTSHLSGQCNYSCSHWVCYWSRRHWTQSLFTDTLPIKIWTSKYNYLNLCQRLKYWILILTFGTVLINEGVKSKMKTGIRNPSTAAQLNYLHHHFTS